MNLFQHWEPCVYDFDGLPAYFNMSFLLFRGIIGEDWRFVEFLVCTTVAVIEYQHLPYAMLIDRKLEMIHEGSRPLWLKYDA